MMSISCQCRFVSDLELITTENGGIVLNARIAIYGMKKEVAYREVNAWGKTAENLNNNFKKNDVFYLSQGVEHDSVWLDDAGKKHSKSIVTINNWEFLLPSNHNRAELRERKLLKQFLNCNLEIKSKYEEWLVEQEITEKTEAEEIKEGEEL